MEETENKTKEITALVVLMPQDFKELAMTAIGNVDVETLTDEMEGKTRRDKRKKALGVLSLLENCIAQAVVQQVNVVDQPEVVPSTDQD